MKKVISFSLYGDNPLYCEGAIENIKIAKKIYPEWECWFYVDITVPYNIIKRIENEGGIIKHPPKNIGGMFWRFYAILDPEVEYFISRDCDSRLNQKEVAAVDEWIKSNKILHTMHDNPEHAGAIILGGMWGV